MSRPRSAEFLRNTFANVALKIVSIALGLILTPLFVRNIGTELYAIWVFNFTLLGYFYIVDSGLSSGVVKHVAEAVAKGDDDQLSRVITSSILVYLCFGVVVLGISFALAQPILGLFNISEEHLRISISLFKISGLFAVALWPLMVFPSVLQALLENIPLNLVKGGAAIVQQALMIVAVTIGMSLDSIISMYFGVSIISGIILAVVAFRKIGGFTFSGFDFRLFRSILGFSFALLVLEFIALLGFQADKVIIAYFVPIASVAYYDVITKLFYQIRGLYGMFLAVVQPMVFSATAKMDKGFIQSMSLRGTRFVNMAYVPLVVLGVAVSKPFIELWMGSEFGQFGYWSSFFLLQYVLSPVVGVLGSIAIGMSKVRSIQVISAVSVVFNVIISIILVQHMGFTGVLVGTVIMSFVVVPVAYVIYCSTIDVDWRVPLRANWKITITHFFFIVISSLTAQATVENWFSLLAFSGTFLLFVYSILYMFMIDEEEKQWLRKFMRARTSL